jgi:uncharacterized protein involved in exopolysaccharide biosynthesis
LPAARRYQALPTNEIPAARDDPNQVMAANQPAGGRSQVSTSVVDTSRADEALDFQALYRQLWAGRLWIAAASLSVALLAVIAAFVMTPVYRSTAVLIPVSAENASLGRMLGTSMGSLGGLAALAGIDLNVSDSATQEALAVLRSRQFADRFIAEKNLMPLFFRRKWDAQAGKWKVPVKRQPTAADAFKYFDRRVRSVTEDRKTGLIVLRIVWRDREAAAAWANELVARLNSEMQHRAIAQAEASLGFLKKELEATNLVDTRISINRLIETQINQRMLANVTAEYAFRVIDRAVPADEDDVVRPKKLLMVVIGAFLGFIVGILAVLMFRPAEGRRTWRLDREGGH